LLRDQIKRLSDLREEHQAQDDLASKSVVLEAERDLSYYVERLRTAVLVEPQPNPSGQVRFGSFVSAVDEEGSVYDVRLVGEDEADVPQGLVSYVSPLAKALMGARVGDDVLWQRPAGVIRLEILTVDGVSV
jgi:transcription elongation GreA/GreB family factor